MKYGVHVSVVSQIQFGFGNFYLDDVETLQGLDEDALERLREYIREDDFFLYKIFAPKMATIERQTFEQTKSYQSGMIQELRKYQLEYTRTPDKEHKDALVSMILHNASDLGEQNLPPDLFNFVQSLKQ